MCAILEHMTPLPGGNRGQTLPMRLGARKASGRWGSGLPWGARLGILVAAVAVITVATGGTAATVATRRRNTPPRPAEHPPRVDDPLR